MQAGRIRVNSSEIFFAIATMCITPLRIFTYISTMSNTFRLTLTFVSIVCYLLGIFLSDGNERRKHLILFILVFLFCSMNYFGQWRFLITYSEKMYAYLLFFIPFLLSFHYINSSDVARKRKLLKFILLMEAITLVTTIIGLQQYPNAARDLASTVAIERYKQMNIGGYDFIFGLVVLVPFVMYLRNKRSKIICTVVLMAMLYTILLSQYTTALLIAFYVIVLYPIDRIKKHSIAVLLKMILVFFLIISLTFSDYIMVALGDFFTSIGLLAIAQKFIDISTTQNLFSAGTLGDRTNLVLTSLFSFFRSPILGKIINPTLLIGGHSELTDIIASGGICIILLALYLIKAYKKNFYLAVSDSEQSVMLKYIILAFLFIAMFDTVLNSPVIAINAFLIPSLILSSDTEDHISIFN